jgi:hypothetical protein
MRQDVGATVSPLDNNRDMERVVRSMEPATKQANRGGATGAVGAAMATDVLARRAIRDDTQQSVERASALDC